MNIITVNYEIKSENYNYSEVTIPAYATPKYTYYRHKNDLNLYTLEKILKVQYKWRLLWLRIRLYYKYFLTAVLYDTKYNNSYNYSNYLSYSRGSPYLN